MEQDAGVRTVLHRVTPGAALPEGLAGRFHSAEMAADWTIAPEDGVVHVSGPVLAAAGPWRLEPVAGDCFRVHVPTVLAHAWLDVQAVRNAAGAVTGLVVNGNRVKAVSYTKRAR